MGTSFSFAVLLRDFSYWARSSDSNGSPQHSNRCRCSPYTIFALISAFPLRRLYRSHVKRLVHEGILGTDFYSLFSLLYYTMVLIVIPTIFVLFIETFFSPRGIVFRNFNTTITSCSLPLHDFFPAVSTVLIL